MTQPPANILVRIEGVLSAGKQQEARLLLMEYIQENPTSAHAWWLMSLALTDINQQMDCLQRVLRLEPTNEQARERLAKLISEPPVSTPISPFTPETPAEYEKPSGAVSQAPASAALPEAGADIVPPQPPVQHISTSTEPPVPVEPAGNAPLSLKPKKKRGIWVILMVGFAVCAIALLAGYLSIQRKAQAQAQSLQETIALAETLTNMPLPTLISTWTASPSVSPLPTSTLTSTPSLTPSPHYTPTRTPRPTALIGPEVGFYPPDFSLTDLETGQRVTLTHFEGQPVFLFFWATWCPQCTSEIGSIETIYQTYKDAGLIVLAINAGEKDAALTVYQSANKLTFPILLDPDLAVLSVYRLNINILPRYFFINSSGRISSIKPGELTLAELKKQVDAIMQWPPTSTP